MNVMHEKAELKRSEVEILNDDVSHCKRKNDLIEGVLENRKEDIGSLKANISSIEENWKLDKFSYEHEITTLEEALKGKSKQLIDYINRDRGRA